MYSEADTRRPALLMAESQALIYMISNNACFIKFWENSDIYYNMDKPMSEHQLKYFFFGKIRTFCYNIA